MSDAHVTNSSLDAEKALQVCKDLLSSLKLGGPKGRSQFGSTLYPDGHMAHVRQSQDKIFFHSFKGELQDYVNDAWEVDEHGENLRNMEEAIDGDPTVLIDHDIATIWTPYWFRINGELSHVGVNSFGLLKVYFDQDGKENRTDYERWEWKIVVLHDTGRPPTDLEVSKGHFLN
jgi:hypothetical protein